ncbi:Wzz/FepE/Etk N-terminal domain-containing protein [Mucilaginibacter sp. KACC 22063]|uniref:Wzz/FepE/Etk N-terminal domain-containing protein n=1 Tax=Mucilaginibacter sp. KACC 22063 TaxID=3025666 RepID=UPI002366DEFB|nr:Wzz/FepE/Etk N-terminal domain-containing protein [Mucilaginibacter sp. KACC 22063]WDF54699.1 Wzz/FepE/Etk N-terminal domain-containing protein [Mucilaginibacter sp. KACC 22063]
MNKTEDISYSNSHEISLKVLILKLADLWKYLLSKWILILFVAAIGGILGITYSLFKKPVYKAELSFALEDDKSSGGLGNALGLASQFGIDLGGTGGGAFTGDNLLMLMKSRSMVESTLLTPVKINGKTQTLADYYIAFNNLRKSWNDSPTLKKIQYPPGANRAQFTLQQDSILGSIYKQLTERNLSVDKVDKKLSIITVDVVSTNELFSKLFTEILVKTVSDFYINTKTKKSVQNVEILQKQTDSVRRELNAAITGVASLIDLNPNANPAKQILRAPSQRRQVDIQANQAILTQLVANLELARVSLRKETPLIQIIDQPILPLEKERLGKLKGLILGGFIAGFLVTAYLVVKYIYKKIMY